MKYFTLKLKFSEKLQNARLKYQQKLEEDIISGDRTSIYSALRKLGARPGEPSRNNFTLPTHVDNNLSASQSAEIMADHFATISQDYQPINLNNCPPRMKATSPAMKGHLYQYYKNMKFTKNCVKQKSQTHWFLATYQRRLFKNLVVKFLPQFV